MHTRTRDPVATPPDFARAGHRASPDSVDEPSTKLLTSRFVLLVGSTLAYFAAIGVLMATLPLYVRGPHAGGTAAVGVVQAAFYASALVLRPWAGRLADRIGRRPLMLAGATIAAASMAAYGSTDAINVLIGLRLVTGVGEACFLVAAMAAASDLAPSSVEARP